MYLRLALRLPSTSVLGKSVLPWHLDPRWSTLHDDSHPKVRQCRSVSSQYSLNIDQQIYSDCLAPALSDHLHKNQGVCLHKPHMVVQLWFTDPHASWSVGCVWNGRKTGDVFHQPRRKRSQFENGSIRHRIRSTMHYYSDMLRQYLLGGTNFAQKTPTTQYGEQVQTKRDENHQNGFSYIYLFCSVLSTYNDSQNMGPRCKPCSPTCPELSLDISLQLCQPGCVCDYEQTIQSGVFRYSLL